MRFVITKTVTPPSPPKAKRWDDWITQALQWVVLVPLLLAAAVPVAALVLVFMGAYLVYDFIKSLLQPQSSSSNVTQAPAPESVELLSSLSVRLQWLPFPLEEKAPPKFVNWWNEIFSDIDQYADPMEMGQLLTTPEIPGLHGQLIGYLCYRWKDSGVFLQLFEATNSPAGPAGTSWLVYLDLKTLQWQRMVETGACILDVTPDNPGMLLGWLNDMSEVRLRLSVVQDAGSANKGE